MALDNTYGNRLIASLIDSYAVTDPQRAWASIPRDNQDISKGFIDISYKQFANAINHASWWLETNLNSSESLPNFEVLAYAGPKDLRYPILAVAMVKVGKQVHRHLQ